MNRQSVGTLFSVARAAACSLCDPKVDASNADAIAQFSQILQTLIQINLAGSDMKTLYYHTRAAIRRALIRRISKSSLQRSINFDWSINLLRKRLTIPIRSGSGYEHIINPSEPWMLELLSRLTSWRDGTFVDIGVNVGQTLVKYKATGARGQYIGFEANPECFFYLAELIKVNMFDDVLIIPVGISNSTRICKLDLFYETNTDSGASLVPNFRPSHKIVRSQTVLTMPWQEATSSIDTADINIVKIDVEGGELEVFQSMRPLLSEQRPIVLFEILPAFDASARPELKQRQDEIQNILQGLNYTIFRVRKNDRARFAGIERIEDIGVHSDLSLCDYVAAKGDECAVVQRLLA